MENNKTEVVHVRIEPNIKKESESILKELGVSTSYAISMFLKQVILKRAIPFEIALPNDVEAKRRVDIAGIINMTGGKEINGELKEIIELYAKNKISYETACLIIERSFS